ncbi:MAG TPA: dihydroneopterin aldolase, partial [Nitrospiraceae bacterium]|nr:dihydroneopterin aldolase [Nitrospiraceae bacterium]
MAGKIIIERLKFQGYCGVTSAERRQPQPLAVDLELTCQTEPAAASDDIHSAVDYAQVADRVRAVGATQNCALLETFAERLLAMLFSEFPIEWAKIWVRKLEPPLKHVTGSVGVQLERSRLLHHIHDGGPTPARFLVQQLHRLPKGKALDVAAGAGRNALYLAAQGFDVDAIDRDEEAMVQLAAMAKQRNLPNL